MEEIWRDIDGYNSLYEISNLGNIKSKKRKINNRYYGGKILVPIQRNKKYFVVNLYKNNKSKSYLVHRLVAQTFLENPNNLPQVNHKDENKDNNCVNNLEWCSSKYNINYGTRNKKISKRVNQYDINGNFIKNWESISSIYKNLKISRSNILNCCKGIYKQAGGYVWKFD